MSVSFFIVGGVIFAAYLYLMFWNIFYSSKKQREENYPMVEKPKETKLEKRMDKVFLKTKPNGKR